MSNPADAVALSLTPFSWRRDVGSRLRAGEPPDSILASLAAVRPDGRVGLQQLAGRARTAIERAEKTGIRLLPWADPLYPAALTTLDDPPPVLWVRGDPGCLSLAAVAIVGSRAGTPYALAVAERLACDLVSRGIVVISGLARGVDSAAHRGAVEAGGRTVAVLGSGVDVIYPPEHARAALDIAGSGAVISELPPGTRPLQWFFPLRNRIISGLSRAVVVVEAGEKSGSLITARWALEQGRDVLAVPGSVLGDRNRGGHALLRDGAKIVESGDDILEELDLHPPEPAGRPEASDQQGRRSSQRPPDAVLDALSSGQPVDLDGIAAATGWSSSRLLPRLLDLELEGVIRRTGGGRFIRLDRSC